MAAGAAIDAPRVLADLAELERRTGGPEGARRLCWSEGWRDARALLAELLAELGLEPERDEAGNLWATLPGAEPGAPALALGSHLDSVPAGGRLDGALGVIAALGVLRAWAGSGERPPRPLALVDWADEEGARFGRSLLGSSAFAGTLEPEAIAGLRDGEGRSIAAVLAEDGVELQAMPRAARRQAAIGAYLELHIEQGPVLEAEGRAVAAVRGCAGVERRRFAVAGRTGHAGTTPIGARHDAALVAAEAALAIEAVAERHGGVATTGALALRPGVATAVAGEAELDVDLRHSEAGALAAMLAEARAALAAAAARRGCELGESELWRIEPVGFDERLVGLAAEVAAAHGGRGEPLVSGALHDAAELARVVPAAMLFCPSTGGVSHAPGEATPEADLLIAIEAFGTLSARLLDAPGTFR